MHINDVISLNPRNVSLARHAFTYVCVCMCAAHENMSKFYVSLHIYVFVYFCAVRYTHHASKAYEQELVKLNAFIMELC